jgi:hypothetical protein
MNRFVGVALSVLVNAALLALLQLDGNAQQAAPQGEVHITQLDAQPSEVSRDWMFAETRA